MSCKIIRIEIKKKTYLLQVYILMMAKKLRNTPEKVTTEFYCHLIGEIHT